MGKPIVIGIDLGTQQLKLVAADVTEPSVIGSVSMPIHAISNEQGAFEQDSRLWWEGCCHLMKRLLDDFQIGREDVAAIGLSGHMHSLVPLSSDGIPTHNCITWADSRAAEEARIMVREAEEQLWNPAIAAYTAPKILWLKRYHPAAFAQTKILVYPKDYLRLQMTGELHTDYSDASGSLLWDFATRDWDYSLAEKLGISGKLLPTVVESSIQAGEVTATAAQQLGLRQGIPVATGAGDVAAAIIGSGTTQPKGILINAGTAAQIIQVDRRPSIFDPAKGSRYLFELGIGGRTFIMGALPSAGLSVEWWRRSIHPQVSYEELDALAASEPTALEEVLFLPYLQGTGTPHMVDDSLGAFLQLSPRSDSKQLTRAVLEGVAFGIRSSVTELIAPQGLGEHVIDVTGGLTKSGRMRSILTNVLGVDLQYKRQNDVSAVGAVALGASAAGVTNDLLHFAQELTPADQILKPEPGMAATYYTKYQRYLEWVKAVVSQNRRSRRLQVVL